MNINEGLLPHILCAISSAPDQQQTFSTIVRFVEEKLGEEGKQVSNIKNEIEKALQIAAELGLISSHNNIVRLRFNPNSKPPFGFQGFDGHRESRDVGQMMDDDGGQNGTLPNDNKVATGKGRTLKNLGKKTSDIRKKSRGRSKRGRSKSRRRRRRR